jgi:hypothetical protein
MNIIDGFLKIWKEIKLTQLYILFLIGSFSIVNVFMFISIFLFHKTFYIENKIGIVFTFTFVLSIIWYSILSTTVLMQINRIYKNQFSSLNKLAFVNGFASVFLLSIVISIFYVLNNIYKYKLHYHVVLSWMFGVVLFSLMFELVQTLCKKPSKLKDPKE